MDAIWSLEGKDRYKSNNGAPTSNKLARNVTMHGLHGHEKDDVTMHGHVQKQRNVTMHGHEKDRFTVMLACTAD